MKVFAISDPHLSFDVNKPMAIFGAVWENHWSEISEDWNSKVSDDDIVLIAGDISWAMRLEEAKHDLELIGALKGKKILIRGNHDYWWSGPSKIKAILPPDMYIIQNDAIRFDGYVFAGSRGWTVPEVGVTPSVEDAKLLERERLRMEMSLKKASELRQEGDKLTAMVHFPPFDSRFCDSCFTELFREYKVDAVVYGHLHGNGCRTVLEYDKCGIKYYLTSCDKVSNRLVEIYK